MKLTLQDVKAITHGALAVREENGKFIFCRFSDRQQALYDKVSPDNFSIKTWATSGVRLEMMTNTKKLSFDYYDVIASSRTFYYFDITVDGLLVKHFGHEDLREAKSTVTVRLDGEMHRVAVYLPCLSKAMLYNITVDDGAVITPVQKSRRMICYGDSITQGYDAKYPSQSYANLIADKLDAEMIDQGIGGEIFRPELVDAEMDLVPDIITVAYGTNDWSGQEHDSMQAKANGFYKNLRAAYPTAKIFALTPIWRADDHRITKVGPFSEAVKIVTDAANAVGAILVDGQKMVPHVTEIFSDKYLHPNDYGFKFYANALFDAIKPHLD